MKIRYTFNYTILFILFFSTEIHLLNGQFDPIFLDPGPGNGFTSILFSLPDDDQTVFIGSSHEAHNSLWVTDYTTGNTRQIFNNPIQNKNDSYTFIGSCPVGHLFTTNDGSGNFQLWKIQPDLKEVNLIASLESKNVQIIKITSYGHLAEEFFFSVANGLLAQMELWKTDGTQEGTTLHYIFPDFAVNYQGHLRSNICFEDKCFFIQGNMDGSIGLWKYDNNKVEIASDQDFNKIGKLTRFNDDLLFLAKTPDYGLELWKSGGTSESTDIIIDLIPGPTSGVPGINTAIDILSDGKVMFSGDDGTTGIEPWFTEGSEESTYVVDINPGIMTSLPVLMDIHPDGDLLLSAISMDTGNEIWKSDTTSDGTDLVLDVLKGSENSWPDHFIRFHDHYYFTAFDNDGIRKIYFTDLTLKEAILVNKTNTEGNIENMQYEFTWNDHIYVSIEDDHYGKELWKLVSRDKLVLVEDFYPGPTDGYNEFLGFSEDGAMIIHTTPGEGKELGLLKDLTATDGINSRDLNSLHIFPNPVRNRINIVINENEITTVEVSIFDQFGRIVNKNKLRSQDKISVDVQALIAGHYFITIKSEQSVYTGKFVKM